MAADVKLLVDVAARLAFRNHCNISTQLLIEAVRTTPPSVSKAVIEEHLRIKEKFEQKQIEGKRRRIGLKVGENGRTFGSVSTKELAEAVKAQLGYDIDKKKMQLSSQIKELGVVRVPIRLHPKVTAELKVNIKEMK